MEAGAGHGGEPTGDGVDCVEQELGVGVCDADLVDEEGEVVGDNVVAGKLAYEINKVSRLLWYEREGRKVSIMAST